MQSYWSVNKVNYLSSLLNAAILLLVVIKSLELLGVKKYMITCIAVLKVFAYFALFTYIICFLKSVFFMLKHHTCFKL